LQSQSWLFEDSVMRERDIFIGLLAVTKTTLSKQEESLCHREVKYFNANGVRQAMEMGSSTC
jgi:hypothetical protein